MRMEVRNQVTMLGNAVAAEVVQERQSHRRWMCLSPVDERVLFVEVEVPVGVDPVEWPKDDDDYVVVAQVRFDSLDMALDFVRGPGINTDTFDALWKSENPF
ncbi:hypothetical protein [Kribbella sp. NPDC049584]|uniref:hypothetical protein n=1 Tax=Kribbella sp. NPDC049584 TaxID=3154833 RepID=UPI003431DD24